MNQSSPNFIQYLVDALGQIERECNNYHIGYYPAYTNVARLLRLLLCDTSKHKDNSLALKVFPDLMLHPINNPIQDENKAIEYLPFSIAGIPDHIVILDIFDTNALPIPLEDWLNQKIIILGSQTYTIKVVIKSVSEKDGGSHVDNKYDEFLSAAKGWYHKGQDRRPTGMHEPLIVAIGEYISKELRIQISKHNIDIDEYYTDTVELTPNDKIKARVSPETIKAAQLSNKKDEASSVPITDPYKDTTELLVVSKWAGAGSFDDPHRAAVNIDYHLVGCSNLTGANSWPFNRACPYYGVLVQVTLKNELVETICQDKRYFVLCNYSDKNSLIDGNKLEELRAWLFYNGMENYLAWYFSEQLRNKTYTEVVSILIDLFRTPSKS